MSTATSKQMGKLQGPIEAVKVFKKTQSHDFNGQKAESWIIFTIDHKMVKATTYDGNLGKKFNLGDHNTSIIPDENSKDYKKAIKGYSLVENSKDLPVFIKSHNEATEVAESDPDEDEEDQDDDDE